MGVNSFLLLYHIYLYISLETPVFQLDSSLIFGEKLTSAGEGGLQ